jgi:UDP-2,4-diacetamido-2,4,6-trideoxy-beta-L-altropyranose hydrolase
LPTYIFTEALSTTGLGHIGRCTALAEKLLEVGNRKIQIILHSDKTSAKWVYPCSVIETNWKDVSTLSKLLKEFGSNKEETKTIFFIDSYLANLEIYQILIEHCDEMICIDDDNRLEYPVGSTILNPGYPGLFIIYDSTKYKVITGKDQVLLRKPFREKFTIPRRNYPPKKVLIVLGGADLNLFSEMFLELLVEKFSKLEKHLVIGVGFTNQDNLRKIADSKTVFYENLSAVEMRDLMLKVDFAITAGGQTTYELDACGVPFVVIQTAENQAGNIRGFVELQGVREIKKPSEVINVIQSFNSI